MIELQRGQYTIYISERNDGTARTIPDFIYTKQVHSNSIHILTKNDWFIDIENDGIVSDISDVRIGVLLADCNGIVLMGEKRYGVVHAWWRWLQNWIIEKAIVYLKKQGEDIEKMKIYVWPSIRQCCYEVWGEFLNYFEKDFFREVDDKYYFDMIAKIHDILHVAGVQKENIEVYQECTSCSENFFSYRKWNNNQRIVVGVKKHK